MILYEGYYSGRLVPWRHYVPLKKDHSNMAEVVGVLRDVERAQTIVDTAFKEVALNPDNTFAAMVRQVDRSIERAFRPEMAATKPHYAWSLTLVVVREWHRARMKVGQRLIARAKTVAKRHIIFVYVYVAHLTPSPLRRWAKERIARWARARRLLGIDA